MENKGKEVNRTKQRKPSFGRGGVPTPEGFEKHPERRHNGAWKKEDTARYKLERMLELPEDELKAIATDKNAPLFERKLATCIATGKWKEIEGMMNQVYGQPTQRVLSKESDEKDEQAFIKGYLLT